MGGHKLAFRQKQVMPLSSNAFATPNLWITQPLTTTIKRVKQIQRFKPPVRMQRKGSHLCQALENNDLPLSTKTNWLRKLLATMFLNNLKGISRYLKATQKLSLQDPKTPKMPMKWQPQLVRRLKQAATKNFRPNILLKVLQFRSEAIRPPQRILPWICLIRISQWSWIKESSLGKQCKIGGSST